MINRRRFLGASALATSAGVAGCVHSGGENASARARVAAPRPARLGEGAPRRIVHVVADGMSMGTLSCTDQLCQLERGRALTWIRLLERPEAHTAFMDMRSLDSLVTDSAAASSSWGSGCRVRNGTLNVNSKGRPLLPLMHLFGQAGWKRGLVTTTEVTHATPAGFTVCVEDRGSGPLIAEHYLSRRLDLVLGGAQDHFDPAKRKDKRNLWSEFAWEGYHVARTAEELRQAPLDRPWLGTFAPGHLPYSLDHEADPKLKTTVPTLAAMTERALEKLGRHEHFLLQIEGGRVDHGAHNNDAAATFRDLLALNDALDRVLDFQAKHPETLVVVTTDHGNANIGLNGMGDAYRDSSKRFRKLAGIKASFPVILKRLKDAKSEKEAADHLAELTGYKPDTKRLAQFLPFVSNKGATLFDQMKSDVAGLGQLLANHTGVGFTGTTHTSDYVPLLALGPGSDRFRGLIRNVDVFRIYTELSGIDYRNPEEPLLAHAALLPQARENTAEYAVV